MDRGGASPRHDAGKLPMGKAPDEWSYGDLEAGFKDAALVLDETFVTPNTSHQTLETRTAMAYWQNGKLYVHTGTQSTVQTVPRVVALARHRAENIVVVSEYTGGGFGSKVDRRDLAGDPGAAVEEGERPGDDAHHAARRSTTSAARVRRVHGRMKVGFAKDGRITALDMFSVGDNGPYEREGDASNTGAHRLAAVSAGGDALRAASRS